MLAALAVLPGSALAGQPEALPIRSPAASVGLLSRVAVIGASVTAGFGSGTRAPGESVGGCSERTTLGDVIAEMIGASGRVILDAGSPAFHLDPIRMGSQLVSAALEAEPTLVVAVDFLFWYGYGDIADDDESQRLRRLDEGIAQLDRLRCPVIVGDLPDVTHAAGGAISASQAPRAGSLLALNRRIHAWHAVRDRVAVFPLASLLRALRTSSPSEGRSRHGTVAATVGLLQPDRVHPTTEGLVAIARELIASVRALDPDLPPNSFESNSANLLDRLTQRCQFGAGQHQRRLAPEGSLGAEAWTPNLQRRPK